MQCDWTVNKCENHTLKPSNLYEKSIDVKNNSTNGHCKISCVKVILGIFYYQFQMGRIVVLYFISI